MNDSLADKVVLITGAGRGIGRATALAFAAQGAHVVLAARTKKEINQVRDAIKQQGAESASIVADVSKSKDVRHLVSVTLQKFGSVDVVVNNAGVLEPIGPIWDVKPKAWRDSLAINLEGYYLVAREAVLAMMRGSGGAIINVSSGAARNPRYGWSAYCTAKAAIDQLTRCMAVELHGYNIRVNAIYPGITETQMQQTIRTTHDKQMAGGAEFFRQRHERGENYPPELPARLIVWLAQQHDLNGQILDINDPDVKRRAGL